MADLFRQFRLVRGETVLGTITHVPERDDFPWHGGTFVPAEAFESVRLLFERSLELLNTEEYEKWDEVWEEIESPGVRLEPLDGGASDKDILIHIDGESASWR
jgi:hypothetical protein